MEQGGNKTKKKKKTRKKGKTTKREPKNGGPVFNVIM